ncbi:uncharacterized protein LOC121850047 [Callorhinchus milii]|uniref:uncharacterized protein LOC121850047 n=1 Tax=Callorhinchus milii TaxID=7868 RepID=UPI001C3F9BD2|nr:uncharacterized protein LOC121850047 [Callorhinchus milii]
MSLLKYGTSNNAKFSSILYWKVRVDYFQHPRYFDLCKDYYDYFGTINHIHDGNSADEFLLMDLCTEMICSRISRCICSNSRMLKYTVLWSVLILLVVSEQNDLCNTKELQRDVKLAIQTSTPMTQMFRTPISFQLHKNCSNSTFNCFARQITSKNFSNFTGPLKTLRKTIKEWKPVCLDKNTTVPSGCTQCKKYRKQNVKQFLEKFETFLILRKKEM